MKLKKLTFVDKDVLVPPKVTPTMTPQVRRAEHAAILHGAGPSVVIRSYASSMVDRRLNDDLGSDLGKSP